MNAILSTVFDMSLTASWVILAVLVIRFLLRKAPRKYSYALWSVAAFRLCCPASFSSALSLFNLPLPALAIRQSETATQITQSPVQVIPTAPVTPIDPTVPILPQLPAAAPTAPAVTAPAVTPTVNTAELWLTAVAVLWCVGMAALLVYAVASYMRLHRQLSTAIRLEGNVYQAENIRSPFILGFLRPKIYIPYGLDADALGYVLAHERTHLRRLDHIVKPLAFLLLTVHWFNPLVWLAFFLMSRDMEMSCDEAVLAHAGSIRKAYSTTLLSFAANRRFPAPSPLAFGETGVKRRIRNVLNWKKPAAWVTVMAVLVCAVVLIACAADPKTPADSSTPDDTPSQSTTPDAPSVPDPLSAPAEGGYLSAECLYLAPYSSRSHTGDSGCRYKIADWTMVITHRSSGEVLALSPDEWGWKAFPWTEAEWDALFMASPVSTPPEISGYIERLYQPLSDQYCLLQMDGALWLMETSAKTGEVWSIYALQPEAQNGSVQWEYTPYLSSRYPAFAFIMELPANWRASAYCQNARLSARTDTSGSALQQQSVELSDGDILYWHPTSPLSDGDEIHLTSQTPDNQLLEATLCIDLATFKSIYTATLTGTDFVLYREENSWYATLALAEQAEEPESPAAPDTSEAAQLQLIADSVEDWAVHFDYADDRVGYAVTDLDGNGRLEVIAAQQGGTGNYTYASYYEVNDTCTALEKLRYDVPEGDSQPDIMEDGTIMVFYNPDTGSYTWIFQDFLRATATEYYHIVYGLTSMNGEITTEALATEEKLYTDSGYTARYTDSSGRPLTRTDFQLIEMNAYRSHTRYYGILQWLRFDRGNSILELDSTTLLHQLTESMQSFQLAKYP